MGGIFFSFSRGAWGVFVGGAVLCAVLTILTTPSARIRRRVVILGTVGAVFVSVLLLGLLSVESVRDVFTMRATLLQDYDTGAEGRFGEVVDMMKYLQTAPNGWGPMQHDKGFNHAPHNVFVNAFGAYGWLGGISFLALVGSTFYVGWKTVFVATPWQPIFVAYWSVAFLQLCQGIQIDLDRWRHVWLQLGLVWGVAAASRIYAARYGRTRRLSDSDIAG
jgi:O-antigen ligase